MRSAPLPTITPMECFTSVLANRTRLRTLKRAWEFSNRPMAAIPGSHCPAKSDRLRRIRLARLVRFQITAPTLATRSSVDRLARLLSIHSTPTFCMFRRPVVFVVSIPLMAVRPQTRRNRGLRSGYSSRPMLVTTSASCGTAGTVAREIAMEPMRLHPFAVSRT